MSTISLVLVALTVVPAPPVVQGDLKMNLDYTLYSLPPAETKLEIAYEIPYLSLAFHRESTGFTARYRIALEVRNKKRQLVFGDMWTRTVSVPEYQFTVNRDSTIREVLTLNLPGDAENARVFVSDLLSERTALALFPLKREDGFLILRLTRSGKTNPTRIYHINDILEITAQPAVETSADTVRFILKKGNRVVTGADIPLERSPDVRLARLVIPVSDSTGAPRFSTGDYTVTATLKGADSLRSRTSINFRIELPFYYDDSTWTTKVDQLLYIATYEEMRTLKRTPRSERLPAWQKFWQDKDPNPSTEINEKEEEYFSRIEYAEKHFAKGDKGYRSDRARIYVQYGPPDEIESRPFAIDRPAEEIWYYYQNNRTFVFVDRFGSGEFVLASPGRY